MNDELEFAWACGLFEGEGSIGVWSNGPGSSKRLSIQIVSTDLDAMERFAAAFGGPEVVEGPFMRRPAAEKWKPLYRCRIRGGVEVIVPLIHRMWPYLCSRRREQAATVLAEAERIQADFATRKANVKMDQKSVRNREYMRTYRNKPPQTKGDG